MSFQQGLSGLNASSQNLDVIGHNIANANTTGMKASRAEFAELYATSLGSGGINTGTGVEVQTVSQEFTQGSISITGNSLDVAISGNGFFQVQLPNGNMAYSRDGAFKLNKDGEIITNTGAHLMGITANPDGSIATGGTVGPLILPTGGGIPAVVTSNIDMGFNLDAQAAIATGTAPSALAPPLATYGTSITAYDGQGVGVPVSIYFTKTAVNTWDVYSSVNGATPTLTKTGLTFSGTGNTANGNIGTLTLPSPTNPAGTFSVALNVKDATQFGAKFSITKATQDGQAPGTLTAISIDESGIIQGTYSNGKSLAAGQIQLANFTNVQGLTPIGGNYWSATPASGDPSVKGMPGVGNLGGLRAGALEDSNVDLTKELVNMMTAQRAYQANAQTIKTQDQVMSTLVNLR